MKSSIVYAKSVALSGTDNVVIPLPVMERTTEIAVDVLYAAVAAASGVTAVLQSSGDNGTTYANVGQQATINAPANALTNGTIVYDRRSVAGPQTHLKLLLTNLDATNAVTIIVRVEDER